jgi:hypothetical protein
MLTVCLILSGLGLIVLVILAICGKIEITLSNDDDDFIVPYIP